ncbi:MAG: NAD(P)H-hydrate epimerase [Myxococcota bacterium]
MSAAFPRVDAASLPFLTTEQMVEVDRAMIEDARIRLVQMMEHAGRHLAHLARTRFFGGDPRGKRVVVLAGTGGNGGGALVAARRLHGWGAAVRAHTTAEAEGFAEIPGHNRDIAARLMPVRARTPEARDVDLILDGVIGYSLKGAPRGRAAELIRWANATPAPVLSLDTPSGIDTTTGTVHDPSVEAQATMTLALPKEGLRAPDVRARLGELYLADIGVPPGLYAGPGLGLEVGPLFAASDLLRVVF